MKDTWKEVTSDDLQETIDLLETSNCKAHAAVRAALFDVLTATLKAEEEKKGEEQGDTPVLKLDDLRDSMRLRVRLGRAGREDVEWEKWRWETLAIRTRAGKVVFIGLKSRLDWAEYVPDDLGDDGVFLCEDYYMQIEGLQSLKEKGK